MATSLGILIVLAFWAGNHETHAQFGSASDIMALLPADVAAEVQIMMEKDAGLFVELVGAGTSGKVTEELLIRVGNANHNLLLLLKDPVKGAMVRGFINIDEAMLESAIAKTDPNNPGGGSGGGGDGGGDGVGGSGGDGIGGGDGGGTGSGGGGGNGKGNGSARFETLGPVLLLSISILTIYTSNSLKSG